MANDRNRSLELSDDGLLFEGGVLLLSGNSIPTHSGLKGDIYYVTSEHSTWKLFKDGNQWMQLRETDNHSGFSEIELDREEEIASNKQSITKGSLKIRGHLKVRGFLKMESV